MDSSVNACIVAQYTQDRIADATSARRPGNARHDREPKPRHARRWLTRRAPAVVATAEASRTITAVPPL